MIVNDLISVIVPIYNSENTLNRCISSILKQTYQRFELLLIDDGSSDNSGKICDNYASKDERIKVFHKKNGGVSSARNFGIEQAKGEWIAFLDSDDWLDKAFLESLVSKNESDLCVSAAKIEYTDIDDYYEIRHTNGTFSDFGSIIEDPDKHLVLIYVWGKLFKKSIINDYNLRFDYLTSLGEDVLFVYEYLSHITSLTFINETFIYHYCSSQGLSSKKFSYQVIDHSITETLAYLERFEVDWNINLEWRKMDVISSYLKKYRVPSIKSFYRDLHLWEKKKYMSIFITDNKYIIKGRRRILFCFLYRLRFFSLIALLKNIFK